MSTRDFLFLFLNFFKILKFFL